MFPDIPGSPLLVAAHSEPKKNASGSARCCSAKLSPTFGSPLPFPGAELTTPAGAGGASTPASPTSPHLLQGPRAEQLCGQPQAPLVEKLGDTWEGTGSGSSGRRGHASGHAGCALSFSGDMGRQGQHLFSPQENPMPEPQGEGKQNQGSFCGGVSTLNHRILTPRFLPTSATCPWDGTRQRLLPCGDFVPRKGHSLAPVRGCGKKSPALPQLGHGSSSWEA